MTSDLDSLLAAVAADPLEDTRRLALADWAAENDRPDVEREQRLAVALRRVLASPEDDAPRLEYAAVYEQYGLPERAEIVRVQVELAQREEEVARHCRENGLSRLDSCEDPDCNICRLRSGRLTLPQNDWFARDLGVGWKVNEYGYGGTVQFANSAARTGFFSITFARGFAEALVCSGADWSAHGEAICAAHPVRRVGFVGDCPRGEEVRPIAGNALNDPHEIRIGGKAIVVPSWLFLTDGTAEAAHRWVYSARWPFIPPDGWEFPRLLVAEDFYHLGAYQLPGGASMGDGTGTPGEHLSYP